MSSDTLFRFVSQRLGLQPPKLVDQISESSLNPVATVLREGVLASRYAMCHIMWVVVVYVLLHIVLMFVNVCMCEQSPLN